jgi:uncharacterized protein (DUF2062 family)
VAGWRKLYQNIFQHPDESNARKASSVGFGVFMGIVPVWGFQLLIGIPLALMMRLNKALFLIAANISIFPFTAFWLVASLAMGKWMLGHEWNLKMSGMTLERVKQDGLAFFAGGTVLSIVMGIIAFLLTYISLKLFRKTPATAR